MPKAYITIQEVAELANKSVQTVRRAVKAKKFSTRKRKTPQGFNYLISRESVCQFYGLKIDEVKKEESRNESPTNVKREIKEEVKKTSEGIVAEENEGVKLSISRDEFMEFGRTLDKLVSQHAEERQNFLRLVNTLQEKVFLLENQLNLLKGGERKWYHFWK